MQPPPLEQQIAFLARVPLFQGLAPALLEILAGVMRLTREPAGTVLCRQGGPGDACFVVGHGQVDVVIAAGGEEKVVATLGAGHVVGEVALLDGKKRSATIRCRTDASIFTLRRDDFDRLLLAGNAASMRLLDNMARDLAARVRSVNESYAEIFSRPGDTMSQLGRRLEQLRGETEAVGGGEADLLELVGYQPR